MNDTDQLRERCKVNMGFLSFEMATVCVVYDTIAALAGCGDWLSSLGDETIRNQGHKIKRDRWKRRALPQGPRVGRAPPLPAFVFCLPFRPRPR